MPFTHRISQSYNDAIGQVASIQGSYSGQNSKEFDGSVPANTTGFAIPLAFTKASMQALCLTSNQPVTLKTNSESSPGQTITLAAGQVIYWGSDFTAPNPITADVTALYCDNAGTMAAIVKVRVLLT